MRKARQSSEGVRCRCATGRLLGKGESAAIDAFAPETILVYRILVLLRGADTARPPDEYRLEWSGDFYDVWQR
jgi:hypothetical protein